MRNELVTRLASTQIWTATPNTPPYIVQETFSLFFFIFWSVKMVPHFPKTENDFAVAIVLGNNMSTR